MGWEIFADLKYQSLVIPTALENELLWKKKMGDTRGRLEGGTTNFLLISQGSVNNPCKVYHRNNYWDSSFIFYNKKTQKCTGRLWGKSIAWFEMQKCVAPIFAYIIYSVLVEQSWVVLIVFYVGATSVGGQMCGYASLMWFLWVELVPCKKCNMIIEVMLEIHFVVI